MRQLLYDYLRAGKTWRAPCTEEVAEANSSNVVPMDVDSLHRKARVKARTKVTETDTTAKAKVNNQSDSDTLTGIATSVVSTDARNQTAQARANSSMARVTNVEDMDTSELTVLLKRWHICNPNL